MEGTGEIAQQLRAWTALTEDPSSITSTHSGHITTTYTSRSKETMMPQPPWASALMHAHTYLEINLKIIKTL